MTQATPFNVVPATVPWQLPSPRSRLSARQGSMKIRWTWLVSGILAMMVHAPRARADVAPPGLFECRDASAGAACQVSQRGGTCLMSTCGTKVQCPDAGGPPECADGGYPLPGIYIAPRDCLLCNVDAGPPPGAAASDAAVPSSTVAAGHRSSGCTTAGGRVAGTRFGWWLGGTLLAFRLRRRGRQRASG